MSHILWPDRTGSGPALEDYIRDGKLVVGTGYTGMCCGLLLSRIMKTLLVFRIQMGCGTYTTESRRTNSLTAHHCQSWTDLWRRQRILEYLRMVPHPCQICHSFRSAPHEFGGTYSLLIFAMRSSNLFFFFRMSLGSHYTLLQRY